MCNILIYFCNIQIKHMKHPNEISETLEIYACNMPFGVMSPCRLDEWRLVIAELDTGTDVGGSSWSSAVRQWRRQLIQSSIIA
jgi:hypothetical protein